MATDMAELVHEGASTDDGEVIDYDLSGQLGGIGHDDVIAQLAVVCDVAVRHDEVVVTDDGFAFTEGSAVHGNELTDVAVVPDDGPGLFTVELKVLRDATDGCMREDVTVITDDDVVIDIRKGIDGYILTDLRFGTYIC